MTAQRGEAAAPRRGRWRAFREIPLVVHAAALLFAAIMVGYLVLYPTFYGFDEPQHVDRIYATTDGELLPDPGALLAAQGVARAQDIYVQSWPYRPDHSYVDETEVPRGERPSLIDLGAHTKATPGGYSNQLSEHPPAYYWLVGGVMWLVPGDASLPVDLYVDMLRALNIGLLLPVPYLVWWGVRRLSGPGPAAEAAAFVPVLIPGLTRVGATVNNDNLLVLTTTALLGFLAGVVQGDRSMRTAGWVGSLLALSLLTKGNALVLPVVVGAAYLAGWVRTRGPAPWRPFLVAGLGGVIGGLWWLGNVIRFGTVRPAGWGDRLALALGPPRQSGDPASSEIFWDAIRANLPDRFWGGLGLIEPPQLPGWTVAALGWLLVGCLAAALVFSRRDRAGVGVLMSGFVITVLLTIAASWSHYQRYTTIPGVQGRYLYPFVLGAAATIAIGLVVALSRFRRAAPLVVLGAALVTQYLAVDAVVAHTWLPTGQLLRPGNIDLAFRTIARFAPFPTAVTAGLVTVVGVAVLAAVVIAVRGVMAGPAEPGRQPPVGLPPGDRAPELQPTG